MAFQAALVQQTCHGPCMLEAKPVAIDMQDASALEIEADLFFFCNIIEARACPYR